MDIVKTGAKVKDNYYVNTDSGQKKNERVIRIDPAWLIVAGVVIVAAVVLLFLAKRAYDNFYVIRHQRKTKKNDKMRFREKKRKEIQSQEGQVFLNRSNKAEKMLAYLPQTGIITIDEFHFNNEIGGYHVTICYDKKVINTELILS